MFYLSPNSPSQVGGPTPQANGWLYLAYDYRDLNLTKVGITTRPLFKRIRETTENPWYALFAAFYVPDLPRLKRIEEYISSALHANAVNRLSSRMSEWWTVSPSDALSIMLEELPNIMDIERDEGEYNYTGTIYLPDVDPYQTSLSGERLHEYVRFAAPSVYLHELRMGYRRWPEKPNFVAEYEGMGQHSPLTITGPQILIDRVNYDIARRTHYEFR